MPTFQNGYRSMFQKEEVSTFQNQQSGYRELFQKDWTEWNAKRKAGRLGQGNVLPSKSNFKDLLPRHEVGGWKNEAGMHELKAKSHITQAQKLLSGSEQRKAHSDAAVAAIEAAGHAKGILEGTHNPATYSAVNLKARNKSRDADNFLVNRAIKKPLKNPFTGLTMSFA